MKKICLFFLIFALITPSVFGQLLPKDAGKTYQNARYLKKAAVTPSTTIPVYNTGKTEWEGILADSLKTALFPTQASGILPTGNAIIFRNKFVRGTNGKTYFIDALGTSQIVKDNLTVLDFVTDTTQTTEQSTQIQNYVDYCTQNGIIADGQNLRFLIKNISLKSNTTLKNFKFKVVNSTADFTAGIVINGDPVNANKNSGKKFNITIDNCYINGNRANQTNIISAAEDGGRHGIRIVGRTENLTIKNTVVDSCAGDGIEFFSNNGINTTVDTDYCFINTKIIDSKFNWNRRHGMSGDAINYMTIENSFFTKNGLDLNTSDAQTVGTRGARIGASLYGNGADFEGYNTVSTAGSNVSNITFFKSYFLDNYEAGLLMLPSNQGNGISKPWNNIIIEGGVYNSGVAAFGGNALIMNPFDENAGKAFSNVSVKNAIINGALTFKCVDKIQTGGNTINNNFIQKIVAVKSDSVTITEYNIEPKNVYQFQVNALKVNAFQNQSFTGLKYITIPSVANIVYLNIGLTDSNNVSGQYWGGIHVNGSSGFYYQGANGARVIDVYNGSGNHYFGKQFLRRTWNGSGFTDSVDLNISGFGGRIGIGSGNLPANDFQFFGKTMGIGLPGGTTGQRPTGTPPGTLRFNSTDTKLEYWNGTIWVQF